MRYLGAEVLACREFLMPIFARRKRTPQSCCTPLRSDLQLFANPVSRPDTYSVSNIGSHFNDFNDCAQDPILWLVEQLVERRLGTNIQHPLTNLAHVNRNHILKSAQSIPLQELILSASSQSQRFKVSDSFLPPLKPSHIS